MSWMMAGPLMAAGDIDTLGALIQPEFKSFSEDLVAVGSYKGVVPAEGLGLIGIDLGIELTATQLEFSDIWEKAAGNEDFAKAFIVPKLHVHKGLPFGLDVGAFLATSPESNVKLIGGEVRYALVGGNVALPAIAARLSHSRLLGVDQLAFDATGVDVSISKGILMVTPYAGVGQVWATSNPDVSGLQKESLALDKVFVGANLNLGLLNLALELDKTGDASSTSFKFGFRF